MNIRKNWIIGLLALLAISMVASVSAADDWVSSFNKIN